MLGLDMTGKCVTPPRYIGALLTRKLSVVTLMPCHILLFHKCLALGTKNESVLVTVRPTMEKYE